MISNNTSSGLSEHSLNLKTHEFDYAALDTETRNVVQQRSSEIKERLQYSAQAAWEIGQRLFEVRDRLGYGRFYSWLKVEFEWSPRTAYNYISIFESFRSCATFSQMEIATSALYLLASPSTPEEARKEALERAKLGETISPSKAKAITSKHKQKSAQPEAAKPVTVEATASTIKTSLTTSAEPEPAQHTKESGLPTDETAINKAFSAVDSASTANPASADQTSEELELLGKKEPSLFEVGSFGQKVQTAELYKLVSIKDQLKQRSEHLCLKRSHNHSFPQDVDNHLLINTLEICKVLIKALPYFTNLRLDAVWQAIAHRISEETLGLHNWSDLAGSQTDITSSKWAEQQMRHDAFHDALTGLPDRVSFMDRLGHEIKRAKQHKDYLFAVLFLALDHYKVVNFNLGHTSKAQLLIAISRRLEMHLRPRDMVARLEGDEFTILLESIKDVENAAQVANRIQEKLLLPFNHNEHEITISVSIGITLSNIGYDRSEDLLHDAELCCKNGHSCKMVSQV